MPPEGETEPREFETEIDGFSLRPFRTISPEIERWLLAGKAHFDLTPNMRAFVSAQYVSLDSLSFREAQTAGSTTDYGPLDVFEVGQIASDNPFIPPEVEETRIGSVAFRRRFSELGAMNRVLPTAIRCAFGQGSKARSSPAGTGKRPTDSAASPRIRCAGVS